MLVFVRAAMLKAFLKDSAIYGIASIFSRVVQLLLVPLYTRVLAPTDYGTVDLMTVIAAVAMSVLTLEIAQGMARAYGDHQLPEQRWPYASTTLWLTVAAAATLVVIAVFGAPIGRWVLGPGMEASFQVAAVVIAAQLIYNLFLTQLRFELRPRMFGFVTVLFTVVSNALAVVLVVWGDTGVIGVFYGQLVGYLVAGGIAWLATRRNYRLAFDRVRCREMLAYAAPLVLSGIGGHIAMLADRVVIDAYMGLDDVGIYGIGARVGSTVGLLLGAFAGALSPLILTSYREVGTPAQLARMFRVFLLLVLPVLIGFTTFAEEIVRVLAPPAYRDAAGVIPALTLAFLLSGMYIFAPGMELARKTAVIAGIMIITGLENLALNLLMVPPMGVNGAALATMISAGSGFTAFMVFSQRLYFVPHRWPRIVGAAAVAVLAGLAGHGLSQTELALPVMLPVKAAVLLVSVAALALVLLDRHDLGLIRDRVRTLRRPPG